MRRASKGYTVVDIPLFPTMITTPESSPSRITSSPSLSPQTHQSPLRDITRQAAEIPQSQFPTQTQVADEATFISVDVDAGGAATTDIGLDVGQGSGTIHKTPTRLDDAPFSGQTKVTYGTAYTKLIKKVKKLEQKVQSNQARRRARIVISDEEEDVEDPSKQGRMIEDIDEDTYITLVTPTKVSSQNYQSEDHIKVLSAAKVLADATKKRREVVNIAPYTRRNRAISTASGDISTVEEPVNTAGTGASKPVCNADMVQERIKDKGKAIMQESEQPRKIKKKEYKQIILELPKREREEVVAEATQAHDIDWSDPAGGYKQSHFKGMSYEEIRPIFERVWDQNQSFVPMDSEKERESRKKTLARKRAGEKQSDESAKRQKMKDDTEKEDLKEYLNIVPVEGLTIEALQTKYSLIDWEIYTEDSRVYWKIIRVGDHTEIYQFFDDMLKNFDRDDLVKI
ncbi:hypothetical protein Tco_0749036 [Tanacetum coccineum]|uniref:Uncharacterized protein n=1 Tax=Tanacetum coccineum TaxID=301880 RepID=A0ABQ4Z048_9ASTR